MNERERNINIKQTLNERERKNNKKERKKIEY